MELTQNNISTIATYLAILISAILDYYSISIGQADLTIIITGIITLIIAIWSSMHPNTIKILGNEKPTLETKETVLNPEYECDTNE